MNFIFSVRIFVLYFFMSYGIQIVNTLKLVSTYSSRPSPDSLNPPNGVWAATCSYVFTLKIKRCFLSTALNIVIFTIVSLGISWSPCFGSLTSSRYGASTKRCDRLRRNRCNTERIQGVEASFSR